MHGVAARDMETIGQGGEEKGFEAVDVAQGEAGGAGPGAVAGVLVGARLCGDEQRRHEQPAPRSLAIKQQRGSGSSGSIGSSRL